MRAAGCLLFAAACSSPELVYLPPPSFDGAGTIIVALHAERDAPDLYASTPGHFALLLSEPSSATVEVVAVGLAASPAALGLEEGLIPRTVEGVSLAGLPRLGIQRAIFHDGAWSAWGSEPELSGALRTLVLPRVGCARVVDQSVLELIGTPPVILATALDAQRALIVSTDHASVWSPSAGIERSAGLPGLYGGATYEAQSGRVYLSRAETAEIYLLDPDTLRVTFSSSITAPGIVSLPFLDADPHRLMAMSNTGKLVRFEGGRAEVLGAIDVAGRVTDIAKVSIIQDDQVLLGSDNNPDLYRYDGSTIGLELTGPLDSKGFVAIAQVPGLGVVSLELLSGEIFGRSASEWTVLGPGLDDARLLYPLGEGRFVAADGYGRWSELHPLYPPSCGINQSNILSRVEAIFSLGAVIYGAGLGRRGQVELSRLGRLD